MKTVTPSGVLGVNYLCAHGRAGAFRAVASKNIELIDFVDCFAVAILHIVWISFSRLPSDWVIGRDNNQQEACTKFLPDDQKL